MNPRYGISEWFGHQFVGLSAEARKRLAHKALNTTEEVPPCPFQRDGVRCSKKGGVCSIQLYHHVIDSQHSGRAGEPKDPPVITCPHRFSQDALIPKWLGEIFGYESVYLAREVPFMRSPTTGRPAGKIDMVLANNGTADRWFGLEVQAVYFSGPGMDRDFELLAADEGDTPPFPLEVRRPDWRSSSAKRLMPQLQVKVPTLRRWGTKLAVAVDMPFFDALGGPSQNSTRDLDEGDVIWLVPRLSGSNQLERGHWEVLSLEASCEKLLAAETVRRSDFENDLRKRLRPSLHEL